MSKTVNGAIGGAGTGALIGSGVMPGIGTAVGAGVGAILGGIGGYQDQEAIDSARDEALMYNQQMVDAGLEAEKALTELANGLDPSQLSPYQYSVLEQYYPEIAQVVIEQAPELMTAGGVGRDYMQTQAEMAKSMALTGDSPAQQATRELAYTQNVQAQQNLLNQLKNQAMQQGRGGNIDFNLALQGGQQLGSNLAQMSLTNQANADEQRLRALQMMGQAGSALQSNDQQTKQYNTSTLNDYNKRLASMKWDYELNKQNEQNRANQFNIGNKQDIANRNINARNQAYDTTFANKTGIRQNAIQSKLQAMTGGVQGKAGIWGAYRANQMGQPGIMDTAGKLVDMYGTYKKYNPTKPQQPVDANAQQAGESDEDYLWRTR